jgi:hypothetical protein
MTTVKLTYQRTSHDLVDDRLSFHDPETLRIEDAEKVEGRQYGSDRLEGRTPDGVDVVIFTGSKRVNIRDADDGAFSYLGYARDLEECDAAEVRQ